MTDYMSRSQAAGYIFENQILELLGESGFIEVTKGNLPGRGTEHQIDAYGKFSFPTPFTYPIRLIAEAKCLEKSVGLAQLRSFFGVITDISENYIVGPDRQRNTPDRYSDTGCFFSAESFSPKAQDFAWAHNIFIISFAGIPQTKEIIEKIRKFTKSMPESELDELSKKKGKQKEELWNKYQTWLTSHSMNEQNLIVVEKKPSLLVGIIDNTYPVIVVGNKGWYKDFKISCKTDNIVGIKTNRTDFDEGSLFEIDIEEESKRRRVFHVCFSIPDVIAGKIKDRIGQMKIGEEIFDLDIPLIIKRGRKTTRRIIKIKVRIRDEKDRKDYYQKIKGESEPIKQPSREESREDNVIIENCV